MVFTEQQLQIKKLVDVCQDEQINALDSGLNAFQAEVYNKFNDIDMNAVQNQFNDVNNSINATNSVIQGQMAEMANGIQSQLGSINTAINTVNAGIQGQFEEMNRAINTTSVNATDVYVKGVTSTAPVNSSAVLGYDPSGKIVPVYASYNVGFPADADYLGTDANGNPYAGVASSVVDDSNSIVTAHAIQNALNGTSAEIQTKIDFIMSLITSKSNHFNSTSPVNYQGLTSMVISKTDTTQTGSEVGNGVYIDYNADTTTLTVRAPSLGWVMNADASELFNGCESFNQQVNLDSDVVNCYKTFCGCKSYNQPTAIPSGVTNCSAMFRDCFEYNQPTAIPNVTTNCMDMFADCNNYNQPMTIPNGVVDCGGMFAGTAMDQKVIIPASVNNIASIYHDDASFNQDIVGYFGNSCNVSDMVNNATNLSDNANILVANSVQPYFSDPLYNALVNGDAGHNYGGHVYIGVDVKPQLAMFDVVNASSDTAEDGSITLTDRDKIYDTIQYSKDNGTTWTNMTAGDSLTGLKKDDVVLFKYAGKTEFLSVTITLKIIKVTLDINGANDDVSRTYEIPSGADVRDYITAEYLAMLKKAGNQFIGLSKIGDIGYAAATTRIADVFIYEDSTLDHSDVTGNTYGYYTSDNFAVTSNSDTLTLTAIWGPKVYTGVFDFNGAKTSVSKLTQKTVRYIYGSTVTAPTIDSTTDGVLYMPTGAMPDYEEGNIHQTVVNLSGWAISPSSVSDISTSLGSLPENFTVYAIIVDELYEGLGNVTIKTFDDGTVKLYYTVPSATDTYSIGMYRVSGTSDTQRVRVSSTIWGVRNCYVGDDKIIGGVIYYYPDSTSLAGLTFNLIENSTDSYSIYSLDVANNPSYLGTQQVVDITAYKGETLIIGASDTSKNSSCIPFTVPSADTLTASADKISIGSLNVVGTATPDNVIVENTDSTDSNNYAKVTSVGTTSVITGTGTTSNSGATFKVATVRTGNYDATYYQPYKVMAETTAITSVSPITVTKSGTTIPATITVGKADDITATFTPEFENTNDKVAVMASSGNTATLTAYNGAYGEYGSDTVTAHALGYSGTASFTR